VRPRVFLKALKKEKCMYSLQQINKINNSIIIREIIYKNKPYKVECNYYNNLIKCYLNERFKFETSFEKYISFNGGIQEFVISELDKRQYPRLYYPELKRQPHPLDDWLTPVPEGHPILGVGLVSQSSIRHQITLKTKKATVPR